MAVKRIGEAVGGGLVMAAVSTLGDFLWANWLPHHRPIYGLAHGTLLLLVFQVQGLILLPLVFLFPATNNVALLRWGSFLIGLMTIAQFSFWGNYLPRVYPTYLRGTGECFAANIGGRMFGTTAALVTTQLVNVMPGATPPIKLAYAAALVGTTVYVVGFAASFWLPEPKREALPD